ncbi:OmpA family protein [Lentibacter sp. XHP0401]|jgi:OmpA-OmpF porin, OOP family|uniref:OmpA family protein n=1 Tax=Lentibacter sp. XHP0401 TaxID=2984334 RepID=UPI0021E8025B|nr:OmpA family protein [Lentibacter sp. XHP0401]MCV2892903.1 OmpA family protein [Lentibacter sp. XHP0401]
MRVSSILILSGTFVGAALLSFFAATFAVTLVEETSEYSVRQALDSKELTWAEVEANGLQVLLIGTAPSEAKRFIAISTAGSVVDAARVIDEMDVEALAALAAPRFSIEILRNDNEVSLIGLIPTGADREDLLKRLGRISSDDEIADLLESADYDIPDGWENAVDFGLEALEALPRSKISIDARRVMITAMAESEEKKQRIESQLKRNAPSGLRLGFDISSPRPVITPFSLRYLQDDAGPRFDNCSADTEESRSKIIGAARKAGIEGEVECRVGLGVPSPNWADAASLAIAAVAELKGGSVTFSDADVTLISPAGTDQREFDRIVGALENSLPDVFALHAVLTPDPSDPSQGPAEFVATLSPEGLVQLNGRLNDEIVAQTAESFATARFGSATVSNRARTDETLPGDWPLRVLSGLEALSLLSNGSATVTAEDITLAGNTGNKNARSEITKLLSEKLGEGARFSVEVTYLEKLDPIASMLTPDECEAKIAEILRIKKISFEPGSGTVDAGSGATLDEIAEVLKNCTELTMEIAGHTDSQGGEEMNETLSKSRAQAVLNALRDRRIITSGFEAVGYGEMQPIASNDTEEGREANRRIEFKLVRPEPEASTETTLESIEQTGASDTDEQADEEAASSEGQDE